MNENGQHKEGGKEPSDEKVKWSNDAGQEEPIAGLGHPLDGREEHVALLDSLLNLRPLQQVQNDPGSDAVSN